MLKKFLCLGLLIVSCAYVNASQEQEENYAKLMIKLDEIGDQDHAFQVKCFLSPEHLTSKETVFFFKKKLFDAELDAIKDPYLKEKHHSYGGVESISISSALDDLMFGIKKQYHYTGTKKGTLFYPIFDEIHHRLDIVKGDYKYPLAEDKEISTLLMQISKHPEVDQSWCFYELPRFLEVEKLHPDVQGLFEDMQKYYGYQPVITSPLHSIFREIDLQDYKVEAKQQEKINSLKLQEQKIFEEKALAAKDFMNDEETVLALKELLSNIYEDGGYDRELGRYMEISDLHGYIPEAISDIKGSLLMKSWDSSEKYETQKAKLLSLIEKVEVCISKFNQNNED